MVAYSFQKRFEMPILSGRKHQTIRKIGKRRHARPGDELQLYVGMRTKACRLIARARCSSLSAVELDFKHSRVKIDGRDVDPTDFAISDGFWDWRELVDFWGRHHTELALFKGVMIKWDTLTRP
jgi:hypothetical protein